MQLNITALSLFIVINDYRVIGTELINLHKLIDSQSTYQEIEVFLCEDPPDEETGSSPMHATSPTKQGKLFNATPMFLLYLNLFAMPCF